MTNYIQLGDKYYTVQALQEMLDVRTKAKNQEELTESDTVYGLTEVVLE